MSDDATALSRYSDGSYLTDNPSWHVQDSPWKARQIAGILEGNGVEPARVCEVGCGAGEVLRQLQQLLDPNASLVGYEVSPDAYALCAERANDRLEFRFADATTDSEHFDLMLLIDVIEHVEDYLGFLRQLADKADLVVLHIPLDLSMQMAARRGRVLRIREQLGHLHYFNKDVALAALREAGYDVVDVRYTAVGLERAPRSTLERLARAPRRALARFDVDAAARLLGGYSLLVLARPSTDTLEPRTS